MASGAVASAMVIAVVVAGVLLALSVLFFFLGVCLLCTSVGSVCMRCVFKGITHKKNKKYILLFIKNRVKKPLK